MWFIGRVLIIHIKVPEFIPKTEEKSFHQYLVWKFYNFLRKGQVAHVLHNALMEIKGQNYGVIGSLSLSIFMCAPGILVVIRFVWQVRYLLFLPASPCCFSYIHVYSCKRLGIFDWCRILICNVFIHLI